LISGIAIPRGKIFRQLPIKFQDLPCDTTDNGRFYETPDGHKYPSVTTVLGRYYGEDSLDEWRARVGREEADRIGRVAAQRGTAVHTLAENYLLNFENFAQGHVPFNVMCFQSIQKEIDKNVTAVYATEAPLYSHVLKAAGRTDAFIGWRNEPTVLDFKTSTRLKKREWIDNYFVQGGAYGIMIEERLNKPGAIKNIVVAIGSVAEEGRVFEEKFTDEMRQDVVDIFAKHGG
jgi:hypothetical protein